ncbi:hypothetical protein Q5N85_19945, partial [Acinetobacter baumannii]|nr:hypothetical protein [Acinetobacter baumannii]
ACFCAADAAGSAERILRIPQDVESYNYLPFPVTINDWTPENKHVVWANSEFVQMVGKRSVAEVCEMSMNKASDGMKRLHEEY